MSGAPFPFNSVQLNPMKSQYWGDVNTDPNRFRIVMWSSSIFETENDAVQEEVVTPLVEMSRDTYRLSRAVFMARYFEKEMEDERRGGGKCRKRYFACKHGLASVTYSKCTPVSSYILFWKIKVNGAAREWKRFISL